MGNKIYGYVRVSTKEKQETDWENQKITFREAARQLSIAQDTFLRWAHGK